MRVAALYDVHGNRPALEAGLADDMVSSLREPHGADEASAYVESLRGA